MANPLEALHVAIASQLQTIQVANGYNTDAGLNVYRIDLVEDQLAVVHLPAIVMIEAVRGPAVEMGDQFYRERVPFVIGGMISFGATDLKSPDRASALNYLVNDILKAMTQDPKFAGAAEDSSYKARMLIVDADRGYALCTVTFSVTFSWSRADL